MGWTAGKVRPEVTLALICTLVLPTLCFYPFYTDIDVHHCIALEVIRSSDAPYRASFVANLPGIVVIHIIAIKIFGPSVLGFRFLEIIVQATIVMIMYKVLRLWISQTPAQIGVSLYAFIYVHGPGFYLGHPDCFAVLPIACAIGFLIRGFRSSKGVRRTLFFIGSGAAYGAATCFRPTFGLLLFAPILFLFDLRVRDSYKDIALVMIGFTAIVAICVMSYAGSAQGIGALYTSIVIYNFEVYSHAFQWTAYSKRSYVIAGLAGVWTLLIWQRTRSGEPFEIRPRNSGERRFLAVTFIALLAGIASMFRFSGYHLTPVFALFIPVLAATVWEWSNEGRGRKILFRLVYFGTIIYLYPWGQIEGMCRNTPHAQAFSDEWYSDSISSRAASYALAHSKPTDAIEATFCPAVRWRIDRPRATRFNIPQCILLTTPNGGFTSYQRDWQAEYIHAILETRPKYYIMLNLADSSGTDSVLKGMFTIPGFQDLLDRNYRLDTVIGRYFFYLRNDLK